MQLGILVDGAIDAPQQALRIETRKVLLEIERRRSHYFLFFSCSAMIGRATRKQSTPIGAPQ